MIDTYESMTLGEWLREWYETYKVPKIKESSLVPIEVCIRLHVPRDLKATRLLELRPLPIQKALNAMQANRIRQYTYNILKESITKAYNIDLIPKNVMLQVESFPHIQKCGVALTLKEQRDFLKRIEGHKLETLFKFYILTGVRRNEALTMTWSHVDFEKKKLFVPGTKTRASKRVMPLMADAENLLKNIKTRDTPFIFPFNSDYVTKQFKKLCPTHKLHDLRHTFATRCTECGISMKVLQRWMGHSKLETTTNRYSHALDEYQIRESKKFTIDTDNFEF